MMIILLTGVTGFLGKIVALDLLNRYSTNINKIYFLIRSKKNVSAYDRFQQVINNKYLKIFFNRFKNKLDFLDGSLDHVNFGIDKNLLVSLKINIVINCAASVNFNENIKIAYKNNCISLKNILKTTENFEYLKKFIHISTFYVNAPKKYNNNNNNINYIAIENDINNGLDLDKINKKYNIYFENTYVLTKLVAEKIFDNYIANFKKNIIRPSIITNSYNFPLPGWTDSFMAYNGANLAFGTGTIKYLKINKDSENNKLNLVPVDYVARIISDTIFKDNNDLYINADINLNESINILQIVKGINYYYSILNYHY